MTAGRLMLDDGEVTYQRRGDGPPVVLLHAGGLSGALWDRQFPLLARDHTAVRYDARGHGGSSPVTGPFAHHEDLEDLLDGPGLDRATLVGLSLGARTAVGFALAHPDRVTDLPDELHAVDRPHELRARTPVVVGDLDSSDIHAVADLLQESVPGAEEVVVEGAGHLVNLDRPDEFDRVLLRFLRASR
ncbi:alpha/beta fold hydrolase [Actinosynnema sp. NPDC091369]